MEFEKTFDNAALDYDASRPAYPEELYADILRYKAVGSDSRILEIGMGTGKAAAPFLAAGCIFTGIEPGGNLAALASERFGKFDNFSCLNLTLQDYDCPEDSYDLIYAATAFHWIPEEYGYKRVFELLKSGGAFARFAYHAGPDRGRETLAEQIQALYAKYMPPKNRDRLPSETGSEEKVPCRETKPAGKHREFSEQDAEALSVIPLKYGFVQTRYSLYHVTKDFTADEYMALLRTYPDHMALDEHCRKKLFEGIHSAILQNGGTITVYYSMDLELARKP